MKIFGWMQSKLNANKQGSKKANVVSVNHLIPRATCKEEFSDWPQALLAIGTFGNSTLRQDPRGKRASCQNHIQHISPEEIGELETALNSLVESTLEGEQKVHNPLSDIEAVCEDSPDKDAILQPNASVVFTTGKDTSDNTNNVMRKKSLSFLLKKMFSGRSVFIPPSLVRDSFQESTIEKSRIQKILRTILNKKIYPQNSTPKPVPKKFLERNDKSMSDSEGEMDEKDDEGSKWVKTDSEYIVLEI